MRQILVLKVTEICSITKTFLPVTDCPLTTLLLIIGENEKGEPKHIIIPTKETNFRTARIVRGERYSFICYTHEFIVRAAFYGIDFLGYLCMKVSGTNETPSEHEIQSEVY